jgi:sugar phosphate isomerase/epimerase
VTLFSGQWADLPVAALAASVSKWGFDGLELACWGDHFEVEKALADSRYCGRLREELDRNGLTCAAISTHLVGQAVCDPIDARHRAILPADVWGDGDRAGVRARAAERMKDTARAAARFGVTQVNGFTGSPIWHMLYSFPPNDPSEIERGYEQFAEAWNPILDVFDAEGVRFGLEVHPTEIAYDFVTTEKTLAAIDRRPGPLRARVPRPYLPRAHQGRQAASGRASFHPCVSSWLRPGTTRLGLRLSRSW